MQTHSLLFFAYEVIIIRYHYKKPNIYLSNYGETYECNHPIYNRCTLFKMENKGLAVIQQRYNKHNKSTFWTEIDPWLTDTLYLHIKFKEYFDLRSRIPVNDLYPTVTIRQIMWALKLKPMRKERWETCFDRKDI